MVVDKYREPFITAGIEAALKRVPKIAARDGYNVTANILITNLKDGSQHSLIISDGELLELVMLNE